MRKIIQICSDSHLNALMYDSAMLYALCDDGTVWSLFMSSECVTWKKVINIPQNEYDIKGDSHG